MLPKILVSVKAYNYRQSEQMLTVKDKSVLCYKWENQGPGETNDLSEVPGQKLSIHVSGRFPDFQPPPS